MTAQRKETVITIRTAVESDHGKIIGVMPDWWDGRDLRVGLPRLFLVHFTETSFIAERQGELIAFLVGFLSPARPNEGYIHFAGVHPAYRGQGVMRRLYEKFFASCLERDRTIVRCCTSPVNRTSIAFHRKMGFSLEKGDCEVDGISYTSDYNRPSDHKVLFVKLLRPDR
ncbi:MAG: GNAT family N-acetyltransferase [Deltaproteobacteria bacterium]|nr:GNAT family N-acetyltransferase [Deltaproteobacteria bacterium]